MIRWLVIEDFPNYEVNNYGEVRNRKTGRILKQQINEKGYHTVTLYKDYIPYNQRVHRLVANAFYDGDHDGLDVNHIDGNKSNNHLSNLEICTRKHNIIHAFSTGLKQPSRRKKVRVVETGEVYESIRACGRALGLDQTSITQCLKGRQKTCGGYHFEEIND